MYKVASGPVCVDSAAVTGWKIAAQVGCKILRRLCRNREVPALHVVFMLGA